MVKGVLTAIALVAAAMGMVGLSQTRTADALVVITVDKVDICHSRQPQPSNGQGAGAQNNPYGPKKMNVSVASIFSNNGHDTHNGPVFNGTGQDYWGDIIPPFWYKTNGGPYAQTKYYAGMNWNAEGMALYNQDCQFTPSGTSSYDTACEKLTLNAPTGVKPQGGDIQYKLDGNDVATGTMSVTPGSHTITLYVNGKLVDTDVVVIEKCREEKKAVVNASLVCKESTKTFTMTLSNTGNKKAKIELNAEMFNLGAGETTTRDFVDNGNGVTIKLTVDGKVDGTYDGTRPFFCKQGGGSVTPPTTTTTTPTPVTVQGQGAATEVESLPLTGNVAGAIASIIAVVTSLVVAGAAYMVRTRVSAGL